MEEKCTIASTPVEVYILLIKPYIFICLNVKNEVKM